MPKTTFASPSVVTSTVRSLEVTGRAATLGRPSPFWG